LLVYYDVDYESKTGAKVQYLTGKEQREIFNNLKDSYEIFINVIDNL